MLFLREPTQTVQPSNFCKSGAPAVPLASDQSLDFVSFAIATLPKMIAVAGKYLQEFPPSFVTYPRMPRLARRKAGQMASFHEWKANGSRSHAATPKSAFQVITRKLKQLGAPHEALKQLPGAFRRAYPDPNECQLDVANLLVWDLTKNDGKLLQSDYPSRLNFYREENLPSIRAQLRACAVCSSALARGAIGASRLKKRAKESK